MNPEINAEPSAGVIAKLEQQGGLPVGQPASPGLITINLIARDIEALGDFYRELFGYPELAERRTTIYRCLDAGGIELGFNAWDAYELLQLQARRPGPDLAAVTAYCTFSVSDPASVDAMVARCIALGGSAVRQPTMTHYGAYQAVLADPQHHVFRIQCTAAAPPASGESPDPRVANVLPPTGVPS